MTNLLSTMFQLHFFHLTLHQLLMQTSDDLGGKWSIQAAQDELNAHSNKTRYKTLQLMKKLGCLSWLKPVGSSHRTVSSCFICLSWNIFSEFFSQASLRTVGIRELSVAALCLSPGCLVGFQGSGSNLSEPKVTLTFFLANSVSNWWTVGGGGVRSFNPKGYGKGRFRKLRRMNWNQSTKKGFCSAFETVFLCHNLCHVILLFVSINVQLLWSLALENV